MTNAKREFCEGSVQVSFPTLRLKRRSPKQSRKFKLGGGGGPCRLWLDETGRICYKVPVEVEQIGPLLRDIERLLDQTTTPCLTTLELRGMIAEYMVMTFGMELQLW
jgi:hypothetical protein